MWYIDTFLVQAFKVDKMNFRGKWELASQETVITLGELIGKGGMRECYAAFVQKFPLEFDIDAPNGWVAKLYMAKVPGSSSDLCRKVVVCSHHSWSTMITYYARSPNRSVFSWEHIIASCFADWKTFSALKSIGSFLLNHNFEVTTEIEILDNHTVIALAEVTKKTSFLNPSPAKIGCS